MSSHYKHSNAHTTVGYKRECSISGKTPFINSDHKSDYACEAFIIKVHFYGENYFPQT